MKTVRNIVPDWKVKRIHESSPVMRGASLVMMRECLNYVATQFFQDVPPGESREGVRCENLEHQTFADASFDLVVSLDVMEHVFDPAAAYREIERTLVPGGWYIHTTPIYKHLLTTTQRAALRSDGTIEHLAEPEYHGNPIDSSGSLVTFHYGYDLADLIANWTTFDVEIVRFHNRTNGIVGEFTEVIVCQKAK